MFCRNCGNKIDEHQKFCPKCGEKNLYSTNDLKTENVQVSKQEVDDNINEILSEISDLENKSIRINNKYYDNEFAKIEQGYDTKFNWAAFLFGPILILYRKMYKFFKKMYLPLYIAMVIVCILMIINISFIFKGNEYAFAFMFLLLGINGVLGILNIIFSIRCGKQYNIEYYYHLKDVMNNKEKSHLAKPSFLAPIIFFVINLIICIALILSGVRIINNILFENINQVYDSDYEEDNSIKEETDVQYQEEAISYKPMVEYLGMTKSEIENELNITLNVGTECIYNGGAPLYEETGIFPYTFSTYDYSFDDNGLLVSQNAKITEIISSEGMVNDELPVNITISELQNMFEDNRLGFGFDEILNDIIVYVLYDNYAVIFRWNATSDGSTPTTWAKSVMVTEETSFINENSFSTIKTDNSISLFPADNSLDCISLTGREMVSEDKYAEMTVDLDNNGYNAHFFISRNAPNAMNFYGYPEWLKSKFVAYKYFGNEYILDGAYDEIYNLNDDYVVQLTVYDLNSDGVDEILFTTSNNVDESVTEIYSVNVASTSEPFIYRGYILGSYELIYSDGKILSKKQGSEEFSEYIYSIDNDIEYITELM